jgi:hypothetical protein
VPKQERAAGFDAHLGKSCFQAVLARTCRNPVHLDADSLEIAFARFDSEADLREMRIDERDGMPQGTRCRDGLAGMT